MGARRAVALAAVAATATACGGIGGQSTPSPSHRPAGLSDVAPAIAHSQRLGELPPEQQKAVAVVLRSSDHLQSAANYLAGKGITVVSTDADTATVMARGPVRALEAAFGVRLYRWHDRVTGEEFSANEKQRTLPEPLGSDVLGVLGLDDSARLRPLWPGSEPNKTPLTAAQIRRAYNAQPLLDSGTDGTGQTVAIFAEGGFSPGEVGVWNDSPSLTGDQNLTPLTAKSLIVSTPGGSHATGSDVYDWAQSAGNPPSSDVAETEAELDIEAVHGMAPGAAIHVYEAPDDPGYASSILALASFIVGVGRDGEQVASISWGTCEGQINASNLSTLSTMLENLARKHHVSVFAGSGDSGRFCYDSPTGQFLGPNYPADDPWVTAVGGTYLRLNADDTLNLEEAWDEPSQAPTGASGGGESMRLPRQPWQVGLGDHRSNTTRLVPDVAADADKNSGMRVHAYSSELGWGTSLATPLWAGVAALYDQYAAQRGGGPLSLAAAILYPMAGQADRPLFDVTTGEASTADLATPLPGPGWDASTGLGSPNVAVIVRDGVEASLPRPSPTSTPQPPPTTVKTFEPWVLNGASGEAAPADGLVVRSIGGTCDQGAQADPGRAAAFRCVTADGVRIDACFAPTAPLTLPAPAVLCSTDPTSKQVTLLSLTQPLPTSSANRESNADPWFLVLAAGQKCARAGSGTNTDVLTYWCADGTLVTAPDQSTPTWTVHKGTFKDAAPVLSSTPVAVEEAYR